MRIFFSLLFFFFGTLLKTSTGRTLKRECGRRGIDAIGTSSFVADNVVNISITDVSVTSLDSTVNVSF